MSKIGHLFERWVELNSKMEEAITAGVPGNFSDELFWDMKDLKREILEFLDKLGDKELHDYRESEYVRVLKEAYGYNGTSR